MDTNLGRLGLSIVADGSDEVRKAGRTNLARGASQIKIMVGGGVSSLKDPLFTSRYADLLVVDGNPLDDLAVIGANPKWFDAPSRDQDLKTLRLIMKDGKVYKNTL